MEGLAYDLTTHSLYMGNVGTVTVARLVPEPTTPAIFVVLFLSLACFSGFQSRWQS